MRPFLWVLALVLAGYATQSPETTALNFERERVRGDVAKARGYLSEADEAEIVAGRASVEEANLTEGGIPSAVVDSVHTLPPRGDTAGVAVYYTGPNL